MAGHFSTEQPRTGPLVPLPLARRSLSRMSVPRPLTSFVGRAREVGELRELLARDEVRIVTLTGPGGVGKTRLALRVAEELAGVLADGVVFVELAQVRDPELVVSAVARTLEVREAGGHDLEDGLVATLAGRELLLVLDNLEHLLAAAPRLAYLMQACPGLKLLVTSRELLRIAGEQVFPVSPLPLPEREPARMEDLAAAAVVRLLVERAQAMRPDFALDDGNAAAIAEICRRVDGLPLGIELAAARLRHLSVVSLLAHLDRRLPVLTDGPRDPPARLRTMSDAIAWSYDLLTPDEQTCFRRLSVFVGGFTLAAAEAVASRGVEESSSRDGERSSSTARLTDSSTPLDRVASLVDKSLLRLEAAGEETRYGMLETVREFGREQLAAAGEESTVHQRHAEWYLAFAEDAGPRAKQPGAAAWIGLLESEHPNLRAALGWLAERRDGPRLMRLAGSLWPFWQEHAYLGEGHRWLELALDLGREAPAADRLQALTGAGTLAWYQTRVELARHWHGQALALAREVGDRATEAFAHCNLSAQDQARSGGVGEDGIQDLLHKERAPGLLDMSTKCLMFLLVVGDGPLAVPRQPFVVTTNGHPDSFLPAGGALLESWSHLRHRERAMPGSVAY